MEQKAKHIFIAADHAGFKLKGIIKKMLEDELGYSVTDLGAGEFNEEDDYPDFGAALAQHVTKTGDPGIALCGSGIGICTVLNKHKGINAGLGFNLQAAEKMRSDDDTNVLCLAGRMLTDDYAKAIVRRWLETPFSGAERHARRVAKMRALEQKNLT